MTFRAEGININANWSFRVGALDDSLKKIKGLPQWASVDLPHTPNIEPQIVNDQFQGVVWYKKNIASPPTWQDKKVFLRFEAAMRIADVWLNDEKLGTHMGGYLPFVFDISDKLHSGKNNVLTVKLDNRDNAITGPKPLKRLDFNTYGGLYRDVSILVKNKVHITDEIYVNKKAGGGIFVKYPLVSEKKSIVSIQTDVKNEWHAPAKITVKQTLLFDNDVIKQSSQKIKIDANTSVPVSQKMSVKNAHLWHPNSPSLYTLITQLIRDDAIIEERTQRIGIRSFSFNQKNELLINGNAAFLRGVNRHQEHPHIGYAVSKNADYRDAYRIKSAGFDYVRLSHYPQSDAFMDAADELGLVVLDAVLGWQFMGPMPAFGDQIEQTCRDLIRRNRNHASVLAWECSLNETAMPEDFIARLHATVKEEYPEAFSAGWKLGFDIYLQARQHRLKHYDAPTVPYLVSEYGDWEYHAHNAGLNQHEWKHLKKEARSSRQLLRHGETRLLQQAKNIQEAHNDNFSTPAFADGYWVMFDYNRGYHDDIEASGIMNLYRLPKYSYYFFQSQRRPEEKKHRFESGPMVHIASDWTASSSTYLTIYGNVEEVELFLNGEPVSHVQREVSSTTTQLAFPPFHVALPKFMPGELVAYGVINGRRVAEHRVSTPGKIANLQLSLDESGRSPEANDVLFAHVRAQDASGHTVPINDIQINFMLGGHVELVNPDNILTEKGVAGALIRTGNVMKGITIQAEAKSLNLKSNTVHF